MRNIHIDLSNDNTCSPSSIFGGFIGEHNESNVEVKLPDRLISENVSYYYFKFELEDGTSLSSPQILETENQKLNILLWQQLTQYQKLKCNVIAEQNNNGTVSVIGKSPTFILILKDSAMGERGVYSPTGSEEVLQKAINDAIKNAKQQGFLIPEIYIPYIQNVTVNPNIVTNIGETEGELNISLGTPIEKFSNEWIFTITQGETAYDVVLPEIEWQLGIAPTFAANSTTEVRLYYIGNTLKGVWN